MDKRHPALAALDFADVPAGAVAVDALLKRSPVGFLRSGTITAGRFLALFGGSTAAVEEALDAARRAGGEAVIDWVLLPDIHPELYAAVHGARQAIGEGSLAVLETDTVSSILRIAEQALKNTAVRLLELRLADAGLAGKGIAVLRGDLHDVDAAVAMATATLEQAGRRLAVRVIAAPHDALLQQLEVGSSFAGARVLELEGEEA